MEDVKTKSLELKAQFGDNAKYVAIEVLDVLKGVYLRSTNITDEIHILGKIDFWRQVKNYQYDAQQVRL